MVLDSQFLIRVRQSEQETGEAVSAGVAGRAGASASSKGAVEAEAALGLAEEVLNLLVDGPASAELQLMGSLGQRDVVADLVVIGLVVPRPAGDFEVRADAAAQVDVGDAAEVVRASEKPGVGADISGRKCQALQAGSRVRNDIDYVSVVIESHLVEQGRADRIGRVDNAATRWITEGVADSWKVVAAPLAGGEVLCNLFRDVVSEDGELRSEVVIDANDFFPKIRRGVGAADEIADSVSNVRGRSREDAGCEQRLGIRINHARRNNVAGKWRALHNSGRGSTTAPGE